MTPAQLLLRKQKLLPLIPLLTGQPDTPAHPDMSRIPADNAQGVGPERQDFLPQMPPPNSLGFGLDANQPENNTLGFGLDNAALEPQKGLGLAPVAAAPQRLSQQLGAELNNALDKDYSIRKDEDGNIISRGKDRDKKWSTWDKIGSVFSGLLQGGIPGAIQAGTDRNYFEKARDARQVGQLLPRIEAARSQETADQKYDLGQVRMENVKEDNRLNNERLLQKGEEDKAKRTAKARADFRRAHPFFDGSKATPADRNALAAFGETPESMGAYDFSKPDVHQVAGITYKFNPNTQSYEDSGIPHDGSKALTEYTVQDPDTGVTYKYTTTNERAAGLKTQLRAAGLQIQAANARQASQQTFTAEKEAAAAQLQIKLIAYKAALEEAQNSKDEVRKIEAQERAEKAKQEMLLLRKALED